MNNIIFLRCIVYTLKTHIEADSYVLTKDNNIVKVFNIIQAGNENEAIIICKQFINPFPLFKKHILYNNVILSINLITYSFL